MHIDDGNVPCHVRLAWHWCLLLRPVLISTFLTANDDP
jgi:hypothetical protein